MNPLYNLAMDLLNQVTTMAYTVTSLILLISAVVLLVYAGILHRFPVLIAIPVATSMIYLSGFIQGDVNGEKRKTSEYASALQLEKERVEKKLLTLASDLNVANSKLLETKTQLVIEQTENKNELENITQSLLLSPSALNLEQQNETIRMDEGIRCTAAFLPDNVVRNLNRPAKSR